MKNSILILLITFCALNIHAQNDTTITITDDSKQDQEIRTILNGKMHHGGYLGLTVNYTEINGTDGVGIGGRLAWIIDRSFAMGIGGTGFVTDYISEETYGSSMNIAGGYGGFYLEPIFFAKSPVHVSVPVLFGAGGLGLSTDYYMDDDWGYSLDSDAFLVVEPGVEIELNMLKYFRIAFGAYYRFTTDINMEYSDGLTYGSKDMLNGLSAGMTLKFGRF